MAEVFEYRGEFELSKLASHAEAKFYRACRDTLAGDLLVFHSLSLLLQLEGEARSKPYNPKTMRLVNEEDEN